MNNKRCNIKYIVTIICIINFNNACPQNEMENDKYYVEWSDTLALRCDHFLLTYEYIHSIPESERPEHYKHPAFISTSIYCFNLKKIKIDGERFRMYRIVAVMFPYKSYSISCDLERINGIVYDTAFYYFETSKKKECYDLRHEKIHFDITELYARKARKFLNFKQFDEISVYTFVNYYLRESETMQDEFEMDVYYAKNRNEKTEEWRTKIEKYLEEYKEYSNPIIYVKEK